MLYFSEPILLTCLIPLDQLGLEMLINASGTFLPCNYLSGVTLQPTTSITVYLLIPRE